jgi:hypothetical protein
MGGLSIDTKGPSVAQLSEGAIAKAEAMHEVLRMNFRRFIIYYGTYPERYLNSTLNSGTKANKIDHCFF